MNRVELLAPGGSFESAMAALENGADAVYCGLQSFSARKAAKNLTPDQLSRLRQWTLSREKKVYVALNTILKEREIPRVIETLQIINEIEPDGLIVQDPGLIKIVRDHFPGLDLHGSTQMAVHNTWGLKTLQKIGFKRVVLPRELSIREMAELHDACPDLELEAFIHGAQCYGFSGMCLASGLLLGRSGNRGDCGQICRTWFDQNNDQGYFFSCNDLHAGMDVRKMTEAGICSLKIEGRMKSPAYAASVSKLYRHILDGEDQRKIRDLEEEARVAYARKPVKGHLFSRKGEEMINTAYPSHMGAPAGEVLGNKGKIITLKSAVKLSTRDGLMYLDKKNRAVQFAVRFPGKKDSYPPGQVRLQLNEPVPEKGIVLYKVQSHAHHWKEIRTEAYAPYKKQVPLEVTLSGTEITLTVPIGEFRHTIPLETQESDKKDLLEKKIRTEFTRSGEYNFTFTPILFPEEDRKGDGLFLPPSRIKKIRQETYRLFREFQKEQQERKRTFILSELEREWADFEARTEWRILPSREEWTPAGSPLPYLTDYSLNRSQAEPGQWRGTALIPLSPLQFPGGEDSFTAAIRRAENETAGSETLFALNNWGHIGLMQEGHFRSRDYIIDAGLLTANRAGLMLFEELTPGHLKGCYGWVESPAEELPARFSIIGDTSGLPLFISRNCYRKHSLNEPCKGCRKTGTYRLKQNGKDYTVIVEDCISWFFQGNKDVIREETRS